MNELVKFVKEILMLESKETTPIGLCGFECSAQSAPAAAKPKRKKEMRLSELMDK